jgi:hypothetical protein
VSGDDDEHCWKTQDEREKNKWYDRGSSVQDRGFDGNAN